MFCDIFQAIAENSKLEALNETLRKTISQYHDIILKMKPKAKLPSISNLTKTNSHSDNVKNNHVSHGKTFFFLIFQPFE